MESLDRPYGDDEQDYTTVDPETDSPVTGPGAGSLEDRETAEAAADARRIGSAVDPLEPAAADERLAGGEPPTIDDDPHHGDPAFAPVAEAGGGVEEGFEAAEGQLVENIENAPDADRTVDGFDLGDPGTDVEEDAAGDVAKTLDDADPGRAAAVPFEREALRSDAEYGEADELDVTEVVRDPGEEAEHGDDAGRGPGIAFDR
jgi:hypothetical protein